MSATLATTGRSSRPNPSRFAGCDDCPVEEVSWNDAIAIADALGSITGYDIRLPTEAEWEYACWAGTTTEYSFGDDASDLGGYAWYYSNSGSETHSVGGKQPNDWGLYDMHGNVWEWCNDWYGGYYGVTPSSNRAGPDSGTSRVLRGGSWGSTGLHLRFADRNGGTPGDRSNVIGFRVAAGT